MPAAVVTAIQTLSLPSKTSWSQAKAAYKALVNQYHPDKVAHMGPELREVAARKTLELNLALATIREFLGK